ncbi:MAG: hypothetical protein LBO07_05930 [Coriobacteriales bacterium]|jgi:hypothetical protein|nr:hypothetical protein [Coriobacteriales bacterium]
MGNRKNLAVYDRATFGTDGGLAVDFIGRSNIWIDNTYTDDVIQLGQYLIMQAIQHTYPGELSIAGYDSKLTGLFAPFASLSSGDNKLLAVLSSDGALQEHLEHVRQQIQDVHNLIQGRCKALLDFRQMTGRPDDSYNLIVLSIDAFMLDRQTQVLLSLLMDVGPAAGVSFLIISTTTDAPLAMKARCAVLGAGPGTVTVTAENRATAYTPFTPSQIIASCARFADSARTIGDKPAEGTDADVLGFDEIHDIAKLWGESSRDGLTFSIGRRGQEDISITLGDRKNQRHNVLITGAVGQGKSNLISVIIHSLCLRYSPEEVSLYLLDYKEGVTLQPFANIGREDYLPHAKALGLESDVGFGLAVLEHLYGEYRRRLKLFKQENVRDLAEYRRQAPREKLSRIVVIIDEFQLMFGDDDAESRKVADLLEKSVRLYRAAGIHFILASQSLGGNFALLGKSDIIFSQIPIRIAHKNSVGESQLTLGPDNPEAAYLKPREAIVNVDYGAISQNRKTTIAYADETVLAALRKGWWEKAQSRSAPPHIFDGDARVTLGANARQMLEGAQGSYPRVPVGLGMAIGDALVTIPILRENGKNLALFGVSQDREQDNAVGTLQAIALSLAFWHRHVQSRARFVFANFMEEALSAANGMPAFLRLLESARMDVGEVVADDFKAFAEDTSASLSTNAATAADAAATYIFALGLDKWIWNPEMDRYAEPPLLHLLNSGPNHGVHFFGWWLKESNFTSQATGVGEGLSSVGTRIFLKTDKRTVQSLGDPSLLNWTAQDNRALVIDEAELTSPTRVIPFSPLTADDLTLLEALVEQGGQK